MDQLIKTFWFCVHLLLSLLMVFVAILMVKDICIALREIYEYYFPPSEETLMKRKEKYRMKIKKMLDKAVARTKIRRRRANRRRQKIERAMFGDLSLR